MTDIVLSRSGDPSQDARTWVLTEAAVGGWGTGGMPFERDEFATLAKKAT